MLETVEGGHCLLFVLMVLEVLEVMRRVLLCMLEAVESDLCSMEVLAILEMLEAVKGGVSFGAKIAGRQNTTFCFPATLLLFRLCLQ